MEYVLVKNSKLSQIEKQVNELIKQNYIPLGGPVIDTNGYIIQAMIKER